MKDRSDDPSHHERTLLPRSYILVPWNIDCKAKINRQCNSRRFDNGRGFARGARFCSWCKVLLVVRGFARGARVCLVTMSERSYHGATSRSLVDIEDTSTRRQ